MTTLGCGDDDGRAGPSVAADALEVPTVDELLGLPVEELRSLEARLDEHAHDEDGTALGVSLSRDAATVALVLSRRGVDDVDRAIAHLERASLRKTLDGSCDASIALSRTLAREADRPEDAYAVAYRTARRFDEPDDAACVAEARRITAILEAFRPQAARLAAIDVDPNADDPTAGAPTPSGHEERSEMERWAEDRGELEPATLERIAVYGAPRGDAEPGDVVRVVLHFDRVAVFRRGDLPAQGALPPRIFLDLRKTSIGTEVSRAVPVGAAGLTRVRAAPFTEDTTRIVFDLDGATRTHLFFLSDPYRIVVDFESRPQTVASPRRPSGARPASVVVLDPGHGGNEFGARHEGLVEAELTLDLARRMRVLLGRRLPRTRVLLTRDDDRVVSLEERVAYANAVGADIFISIHLNAADDPVEHGGVATFVLDTTNDRQALRLAARENGTSTGEVTGLQRILAGLHREEQDAESRALAELVQRGTLAGGRHVLPHLPDRGVKSAMFYVLVGARMPAVLLEASFLTQPAENRALATDAYRQALAEGAAEGIIRFTTGAPE